MSNWFCLCLYRRSGVQYFVILCIFMFSVLCCDVGDDFLTKTMFGASLSLVVCSSWYPTII